MNAEEMKKCPFCAESILAEAVKCRYCGSMLNKGGGLGLASPQGFWHRVAEGKKIAGVCTGIARQLDAPVLIMPLRVFFGISTLFYFFGPILYVLLWLLMPSPESEPAAGQPVSPPSAGPAYGVQPPVVNSYPGRQAPPQEPPIVGQSTPVVEKVEVDSSSKGDGTIGLEDDSRYRRPGDNG